MRLALSLLALLWVTGCATDTTQAANKIQLLEKRIEDLEARIRQLEARYPPDLPIPYRSVSELQDALVRLQEQRKNLLKRHTENHPYIVDLERRINMIKLQIHTHEERKTQRD